MKPFPPGDLIDDCLLNDMLTRRISAPLRRAMGIPMTRDEAIDYLRENLSPRMCEAVCVLIDTTPVYDSAWLSAINDIVNELTQAAQRDK